MPRSESAVPTSAYPSTFDRLARRRTWPGGLLQGRQGGGQPARPAWGKGCGTAPVDAQAPTRGKGDAEPAPDGVADSQPWLIAAWRKRARCANRPVTSEFRPQHLDTSAVVGQNSSTLPRFRIPEMEQTLLLNASYEPLKIVNWQKAVTLLVPGEGRGHSVTTTGKSAPSPSASSCRRSSACSATSRSSAGSTTCRSRARTSTRVTITRCQYCGDGFSDQRADIRSRRAGRPGRPEGLGKHRHLLRDVQSPERRADAG